MIVFPLTLGNLELLFLSIPFFLKTFGRPSAIPEPPVRNFKLSVPLQIKSKS